MNTVWMCLDLQILLSFHNQSKLTEPFKYLYRSDDGSRPPNYAEATSDFYPESTSEIVIDTVNSDPPPPYGPPTYDQAMAEKESEMSISEIEDDNDNKSEQENINPGQASSQVPETVTEPDWERDQYISHGYQDMPSVTI
jgi:hypothetical protein